MKEFTIGKNDTGQWLDRWLVRTFPLLPALLAQKCIRLKWMKVNGRSSQWDVQLQLGDILQPCINDESFKRPREENTSLNISKSHLDIVCKDENPMLFNKQPGLLYHMDEHEKVNTLITHIQIYLYQRRKWSPRDEHSFIPALYNRIDRNTGGIIMAAKNAEALRTLNQKIRGREIAKFYLAIVHGRMRPSQGKLEGFLLKDEDRAQMRVFSHPVPDGKGTTTLYKILRTTDRLSLVECELLTGRTHQINAQFAAAGHLLLGDDKYGRRQDNKKYGRPFQALYSYKLASTSPTDAGLLEYPRGRVFVVEQVSFVAEYLPTGERV